MMRFLASSRDGGFIAELRDAGILTPDAIERIDAAMGRPETGTLTDFLLAGADIVPERTWLTWLIRRHGCHRFGRVEWNREIAPRIPNRMSIGENLPYRACADGSLLVAVLRPDRLTEDIEQFAPQRCIKAAVTLREARELRSVWRHSNF